MGITNYARAAGKFRYFSEPWLVVFAEYFNLQVLDNELYYVAVRFRK